MFVYINLLTYSHNGGKHGNLHIRDFQCTCGHTIVKKIISLCDLFKTLRFTQTKCHEFLLGTETIVYLKLTLSSQYQTTLLERFNSSFHSICTYRMLHAAIY